MIHFLDTYKTVFWMLSFLSLMIFLGSLVTLPWIVGRLPRDYFVNPGQTAGKPVLAVIVRNVLGSIVFIAGFIMLFIPGQGLLTMVAGLVLMDFPGKAKLMAGMVRGATVRSGLNWLRKKGGKPSLIFPSTKEN